MNSKAETIPQQNPGVSKEGLLGWKNTINKRVHPDGITSPLESRIALKTQQIVNAAFAALESGSSWSQPFNDNYVEEVGGRNNRGEYIRSKKVALGTPISFLNKLCKFLGLTNASLESPTKTNPNESTKPQPKHELLVIQKESLMVCLGNLISSLKTKHIFIDLSAFEMSEHLYGAFSLIEMLIYLDMRVKKNDFLNIINPNHKITIRFVTKPFGTPDEMAIETNEGKKYKIEIKQTNFLQSLDILINRINRQDL